MTCANIKALVTTLKVSGSTTGYYVSHSCRTTAYSAPDLMTATGRAAKNDVYWSNQLLLQILEVMTSAI